MKIYWIRCSMIVLLLMLNSLAIAKVTGTEEKKIQILRGKNLTCAFDGQNGRLNSFASRIGEETHVWLTEPFHITVRNEQSGEVAVFSITGIEKQENGLIVQGRYEAPAGRKDEKSILNMTQRWMSSESGLSLELTFTGNSERAGHEISIEFPILSSKYQVFTPSERGVMSVSAYPTFQPVQYGTMGVYSAWRYYILPLVSVLDPESDNAVTIALPPDANIPHLHVEWLDAKIIRLRLGHRGMGNEQPSTLKILFYAHNVDYRSVIKSYSDDFPRYFKPGLPDIKYDGAFLYHHIHNHPDFDEMARQDMRSIWTSFWFTHLGEYLPAESEWYPYTYAKRLQGKPFGEKMNDVRIRSFANSMHERGIGVFAYFNVTEYGSSGGEKGNREEVQRKMDGQFADNILLLKNGQPYVTWDSSAVMNPRKGSAFFAHLHEHARRHLDRLPELDGFMVDRLDWASHCPIRVDDGLDFRHDDGFSMAGDRPAYNMAVSVADALGDLVDASHAKGKCVYINQFWRAELMRDADAHVHEFDFVRGLGYVSPYRFLAAWNSFNYLGNDLIQFEAQLKRRLQFAFFPHMIAHEFEIVQQPPNRKAADVLEIFMPLFSTMHGKTQVLLPHCVNVSGSNDVNLFMNKNGDYVAPVTSRFRFLTTGSASAETVTIKLRVPNALDMKWAHVYSADVPPYRASIVMKGNEAWISADNHVSSSVVVIGRGSEPALNMVYADKIGLLRNQFISKSAVLPAESNPPHGIDAENALLKIQGIHVGEEGKIAVYYDGRYAGELPERAGGPVSAGYDNTSKDEYERMTVRFAISLEQGKPVSHPPVIALKCNDEGAWFVPENIELCAANSDEKMSRIALWLPEFCDGNLSDEFQKDGLGSSIVVRMRWCEEGK